MKKITHELTNGIVITLEQVNHHNAHGDVYILSNSVNDQRWAYGRGHSECVDSLHGYAPFHILAEKYAAVVLK